MVPVEKLLARASTHRAQHGRPLVTLAYAQSLDGSISAGRGQPLGISGPAAQELTHRLRSAHDAILVGIGTVLADNPLLTVRLVEGPNPQPVVLDSRLRFPLQARLLSGPHSPWIAMGASAPAASRLALEKAGARLLYLPSDEGGRVSLTALLDCLGQQGVNSLMVEGGARVITSFLAEGLVDQVVLTIAPVFVGGLQAVDGLVGKSANNRLVGYPRLDVVGSEFLGQDLVVWGDLI